MTPFYTHQGAASALLSFSPLPDVGCPRSSIDNTFSFGFPFGFTALRYFLNHSFLPFAWIHLFLPTTPAYLNNIQDYIIFFLYGGQIECLALVRNFWMFKTCLTMTQSLCITFIYFFSLNSTARCCLTCYMFSSAALVTSFLFPLLPALQEHPPKSHLIKSHVLCLLRAIATSLGCPRGIISLPLLQTSPRCWVSPQCAILVLFV